jgi:hypothetical protein
MSLDTEDTFDTVDRLADKQDLISCYQMQVDDNDNCTAVYLGRYPDVPLPVNKILGYKKYRLHVVTYVMTEQEIKDKVFKIVGVNVFRRNRKNSMFSLDLVMNDEKGNFQLLFNDHNADTTQVVENLEKFPGKDNLMEYIINKSFEEPVKSRLLK